MSLKLKSLLEKEKKKMNTHVFMSNWFALVHPAHACFTFIHPAQKYNSAARQTRQQLDSPGPSSQHVSMKALKTNPHVITAFSFLEQ